MKYKNTIAAMGFALASYFGNAKSYADDEVPMCDINHRAQQVQATPLPRLRSGDFLLHVPSGQSNAQAIRNRFPRRRLSDTMVRNIEAEAMRNTLRNYNIDPCNDTLIIPSYIFNRPQQGVPSRYGLTPEDRNAIRETRERVNQINERVNGIDGRLGDLYDRTHQIGDDLNNLREQETREHSTIINKTRDVIRSESDRTRRQSEAERLRQLDRPRTNFVSFGYAWMAENVDDRPYAAGQTVFMELYGARDVNNFLAAFIRSDNRVDFLNELDADRRIRAISLNGNAGVQLKLNNWINIEGYAHADNLSAVIFDSDDFRVSQWSIGPGLGLRANSDELSANFGLSYNIGKNDTTMFDTDNVARLVLDAGVLYMPRLSGFPIALRARYRLADTGINAEGIDRSSTQHQIVAEAFYRPRILPGLALGAHIEETLKASEANDDNSSTLGGVVRYDF